MTTCYSGCDEAGLGPLLGPLSIVRCSVRAADDGDLTQMFTDAGIMARGLGDSKKVYSGSGGSGGSGGSNGKTHKIAKLEQLALGAIEYFTGYSALTAADVCAVMGEDPALRLEIPWMAGAEQLTLPIVEQDIPVWVLPDAEPAGIEGALIHPRHINDAYDADINKSALELQHIMAMAQRLPDASAIDSHSLSVDRLGGRMYYSDALALLADAETVVDIVEEERLRCAYSLTRSGKPFACEFLVSGEDRNPLIAAASCIAKYSRELHMILLNNYWSQDMRWLKRTAGYPQDAKRWLYQIGEGHVNANRHELIRGTVTIP